MNKAYQTDTLDIVSHDYHKQNNVIFLIALEKIKIIKALGVIG